MSGLALNPEACKRGASWGLAIGRGSGLVSGALGSTAAVGLALGFADSDLELGFVESGLASGFLDGEAACGCNHGDLSLPCAREARDGRFAFGRGAYLVVLDRGSGFVSRCSIGRWETG